MILKENELLLRRRLRVAGIRDNKLYIGPEVVHLHITNRCNLRCRHCWYHSPDNPVHTRPAQDMPLAEFDAILKDCADLKVDALYISAEGEPTLHPQFEQMMDHAAKFPLALTVFTNAAFPARLRPALLKADRLIIDISAADAKMYHAIHGADHFNKVIANIKALSRMNGASGKDGLMSVTCIINKLNASRTGEISKLMNDMGINSVDFKPMQPHAHNQDILVPQKDQPAHCLNQPPLFKWCFQGWFYISIRLDGQISYCCYVNEMNAARLNKGSLKAAWRSLSLMKARLLGKTGQLGRKFRECPGCAFRKQNTAVLAELARMKKNRSVHTP